MGESVFSLRKKPPRLTKGVPAFSFPSRRFSSLVRPRVRGPIVRVACCRFRHGPLAAGRFHACLVVFRFSVLAAASSFIFRSAVASVMLWRRPVPAAGRAGHDLSHGLKARRYSCSFVLRRQLTRKGASDSPNFGCPELSGEAVPDAEVVCPANFRAPAPPSSGRPRPSVRTGAAFPSVGPKLRLPCRRVPSRCIRLRRSLAACRARYLWRRPPVASASDGPLPHRLSPQ